MLTLQFALLPDALAALHDALVCLAKFSDTVAVEARRDRVVLPYHAQFLKSAYVSFALDPSGFFSRYEFAPDAKSVDGRFTCRIYNKALLSVFKGRIPDPRGKDATVDRCEVSLQDRPDEAECRLIIKMLSDQGVTKTYKLTYESVEVMHALFDRPSANNRWTIPSSTLKDITEYFGPKTEQLDIYAEDGRVTYTSFTEKVTNGKEILKHPLQTSVSISTADFEQFKAAEKMHIVINVKDFKAIVTHADHLHASIHAYYSQPKRPLQFSYGAVGMLCEFTLMTIGEYQGAPASASSSAHAMPARAGSSSSRTQSAAIQTASRRRSDMPPPAAPISRTSARQRKPPGSAAQPSSSHQHERAADPDAEPLFVQPDEDDARWEPTEYGEEDEETLGWDASADNAFHPMVRDTASRASGARPELNETADGFAPTQRLSQIRGLW